MDQDIGSKRVRRRVWRGEEVADVKNVFVFEANSGGGGREGRRGKGNQDEDIQRRFHSLVTHSRAKVSFGAWGEELTV